jgi:hypothetical protein
VVRIHSPRPISLQINNQDKSKYSAPGSPSAIRRTVVVCAPVTAGVVSIVLGYRLFVRGVFPSVGTAGDSSVQVTVAGSGFTLKNAAPGTGFGVFGVILVTVMLVQASPQLDYETLQKTATPLTADNVAATAPNDASSTKIVMRSGKPLVLYQPSAPGRRRNFSSTVTRWLLASITISRQTSLN